MPDLPDFYSYVVEEAMEAGSFRGGADAAKPASPVAKDIYFATDTKILYICVADGAWTGFDAAILVQGIIILYDNLAGGDFRITNIADPTAAQDAATKAYTDLFTLLTTFNDHSARHELAGADVISVAGLSGLLADDQHVIDAEVLAVAAALVHAARHENAGDDEISVAALSGLLADDQHVIDAEVVSAIEAASPLTLPAHTLGGTVTLNNRVLDAGSVTATINTTGALHGIEINNSASSHGARIKFHHTHTTPALNSIIGRIHYEGYDGNVAPAALVWGYYDAVYTNITDGAEEITFRWTGVTGGVADNVAMTLTGAGVLECDASIEGDAFDEFDDAIVLRRGISERQLEVLEEIGVMRRKDTGSGWMLNFQKMMYLLAGGIYQNRAKIDSLEQRLMALPIGA